MNITFIGSGYVGLVSGVMMSYLGHNVTCLDTDRFKISQLQKGVLPIYEPGLDKYLLPLMHSGKLKFVNRYDEGLQNTEVAFITVGTPPLPSGAADLNYVFEAINNLSAWIKKDCLLVIKSTVPPTTCNKIIDFLAEKKLPFQVASNPEFLREGCAIDDFLNPDRIVIGVNNQMSEALLREIYSPLTKLDIPIVSTDLVTAELIKYASNAFLATKIAFTNEMANLCEKTGANIKDVCLGIGSDRRIGKEFLTVGPGFGGSCFPKDILALSQLAKNYQSDCKVLNSVIDSNQQRPQDMVDKISNIIGNLENKVVTILGLTFKAGTDDIRSSPSIEIIKILISSGANIKVYDPVGMNNAMRYLEDTNLLYTNSAVSACKDSDAIVIATEWPEFKELDWAFIYTQVKYSIIIDLRNLLDRTIINALGFKYYSIGYKS